MPRFFTYKGTMMRKDVNKILTECYKEGWGRSYSFPRRFVAELFDETGGKIGMNNVHQRAPSHGTKSFGENLSYLERFVQKQVGRKWDDIYSEICATFDRRSTVNDHIFQHLFDYFIQAKNVLVIDNRLYVRSNYWSRPTPLDEAVGFFGKMYVDPRDGILKKNKDWKSYNQDRKERQKVTDANKIRTFVKLSSSKEMHKIEGVWYIFTLKQIPEPQVTYDFPGNDRDVRYMSLDEWERWSLDKKAFKALSEEEKKVQGIRRVTNFAIPDILHCIPESRRDARTKGQRVKIKRNHYEDRKPTHYYSEKKQASHKELKAAGL